MTFDVGAVLVGIAALITAIAAIGARRTAQRAEDKSDQALRASPTAILEGLRSEVNAVLDAYHEAADRWKDERSGMEDALARERARADAGEHVAMMLRAEQATMRIDLAATRAELAELRTRFETSLRNPQRTEHHHGGPSS